MQNTKLFAHFNWASYRNDGDDSVRKEVKDVNEAVEYGTRKGASYFTTYEVTTMEIGGKKFTGEAENFSGKHYVDADKLYTRDEVVADAKAAGTAPELKALIRQLKKAGLSDHADMLTGGFASPFEKDAADTLYIKPKFGGFVRLEAGDTAYNSKGGKVWPKGAAAKPKQQLKP